MSTDFPAGTATPASILPHWEAVVIRWALAPDERSTLLVETLDGVELVESYRIAEVEHRMRLITDLAEAVDDKPRVRDWLSRRKAFTWQSHPAGCHGRIRGMYAQIHRLPRGVVVTTAGAARAPVDRAVSRGAPEHLTLGLRFAAPHGDCA
ncbi:hypothetical protein EAH79_11825 [Sphingomonas koreensis]|nr:hypothetical protein EAH79_11825 [Sphingomonas koreensis]